MAVAIDQVSGGTYGPASGAVASSANSGNIHTTGPNGVAVIICLSGRRSTSADINEITAITSSGLTFTRYNHTFTYTDSASDPSFPVTSWSLDVFVAPVPTAVNTNWSSTSSVGDGFINTGACAVITLSGVHDINNPFDPSMLTPILFNGSQSGSSGTPHVSGVSTTNNNNLLLSFFFAHENGAGNAHYTEAVTSGWTQQGGTFNLSAGANSSAGIVQSLNVTSPLSSTTVTAGFGTDTSSQWWGGILAFTSDATGGAGTLNATESPDTFHGVGFPGAFGVTGALTTTEAADTLAAAGYPASVGALAITEAKDTFAATARQPVAGTLAATEAKDTFAATGTTPGVSGSMAASESVDTLTIIGYTPNAGTMAAQENPDIARFIGADVVTSRKRRVFSVT